MKQLKNTSRDLRRTNQTNILRQVYFKGPISRLEVSQQLGISPATVTNIVSDLLVKEVLIESGIKQSIGGRPSTLLKINPDYGYIIGVEVGETFIEVKLFDILFNPVEKTLIQVHDNQTDQEQIVSLILSGIEVVIQLAHLQHEDILGAGIGFPGLVDPVNGVSIFAPNWGWHNVAITSLLSKQISIPMFLDNGANAMAIAELLFGAGKGINDLVVFLVGTGIGSGIIAGKKIFRGAGNNAGEFGHTTVDIDGPQCRCGSFGCLEVYLGASGIIKQYQAANPDFFLNEPPDQVSAIQTILADYEQNIPAARQVVDEVIRYLGIGIANIINALNPEMLLLGGWSGLLLGKSFLSQIEGAVSKYAMAHSLATTTLKLCEIGQGAVSLGAGTLVLEHFFENAGDSDKMMVGGQVIQ